MDEPDKTVAALTVSAPLVNDKDFLLMKQILIDMEIIY